MIGHWLGQELLNACFQGFTKLVTITGDHIDISFELMLSKGNSPICNDMNQMEVLIYDFMNIPTSVASGKSFTLLTNHILGYKPNFLTSLLHHIYIYFTRFLLKGCHNSHFHLSPRLHGIST